jgi:hypothetical protein
MKQPMKNKLILTIGAAMCFAFAPRTFAQYDVNGSSSPTPPNNSILYQPNVNLTSLSQNGFTGVVGGVFLTPFFFDTAVNYLGYADPTDAPLSISHTVSIWDGSGNVLASAVVPSGAPTLWTSGYAWVPLSSTVTLQFNTFLYIGATVVGGVDPWGDLINNTATDNGNNGQITWNVVNGTWTGDVNGPEVQAGSGYEFSRAGQFGNTALPGTQTSTQDSIYPAPNFGFNVVPAPEPGSVALISVGAALFAGLALKRKANKRLV